MELLKSLEREFDFSYPEIYYSLYNDGMLKQHEIEATDAIKEFEIDTNSSLATRLKNQNGVIPFLNAISIIRVLPIEKLYYRLTESYIGENIDRIHKLIPFAIDSATAWFAFSFKLQENGNVPIVLVWDDCDEAVVLAKNLEDFIFRQMLEAATIIHEDIDLEQRRKELQNMLVTHMPYMNAKYVEILGKIYSREFFSTFHQPSERYSHTSWHLIDSNEFEKLKKEMLDFELMGKTFQWFREE